LAIITTKVTRKPC